MPDEDRFASSITGRGWRRPYWAIRGGAESDNASDVAASAVARELREFGNCIPVLQAICDYCSGQYAWPQLLFAIDAACAAPGRGRLGKVFSQAALAAAVRLQGERPDVNRAARELCSELGHRLALFRCLGPKRCEIEAAKGAGMQEFEWALEAHIRERCAGFGGQLARAKTVRAPRRAARPKFLYTRDQLEHPLADLGGGLA